MKINNCPHATFAYPMWPSRTKGQAPLVKAIGHRKPPPKKKKK